MRRMAEDSISDQVATIIRALDERKTRQFTSQNSGMKFKQIANVSGAIPIIASSDYGGEAHIITNTYTPEHGRPALTMPHISFDPNGATFEIYHDYERDYMSIAIYVGGDYIGYMDVWSFYHRANAESDVYAWQTIVYTWGMSAHTIPFTITLRATDSGTHAVNVESATL